MRTLVSSAFAVALILASASPLLAGKEKKDKDAKGKDAELTALTLTGTLSKEQKEKAGKDGKNFKYTVYYVSTGDGRIAIPQPKAKKKGDSPAINLADFVGEKVEISALGEIHTKKDGAKYTHVHRVTAIRKVSASQT